MKLKQFSASLISFVLIATGSASMTAITAMSPLSAPVQAQSAGQPVQTLRGCFLNVPFTGKVAFNPTNIRQQPTRSSAVVGQFTSIGQAVSVSGITTGEAVPDAWDGKLDNMWYRLADGRGWVASAVTAGYPPRGDCSQPQSRLPNNTDAANRFFKMQFQDSQYNPGGPLSSGNCGPASIAMVLAALGKEPGGLSIQQSIDRASDLMGRSRTASFTSWGQLQTGIRNAGGTPRDIFSWGDLDHAVSNGQPVILNGFYGSSWRSQFPARTGNGQTAHLNTILGKTPDNRYIIGDPMHTGGTVVMDRNQLSVFFRLSGQNGTPWGIAATGL